MNCGEDETTYSRIYYVNQNHPLASDQNSGTFETPFKTISQAAKTVKAGEKVVIASGVYREFVQPQNGGRSKSEMICYEAEKGANVVVSGAAVLHEEWQTSVAPHIGQPFSA